MYNCYPRLGENRITNGVMCEQALSDVEKTALAK